MAKVSYKNGNPSWELGTGENKIFQKIVASKYSQEDNNSLLTSTQEQEKSIIERLNSTDYKDTSSRVQLQEDLYSYQKNLARLRLRGFDVTEAENAFKGMQTTADNQSRVFSLYKSANEYNTAQKEYSYSQKYSKVKDYSGAKNIINSKEFAALDEDEKKWLNSYKWQLASSDEIQKEITLLDADGKRGIKKKIAAKEWELNQLPATEFETGSKKIKAELDSLYKKLDEVKVLETLVAQKKKKEKFDSKYKKDTDLLKNGNFIPLADIEKFTTADIELMKFDDKKRKIFGADATYKEMVDYATYSPFMNEDEKQTANLISKSNPKKAKQYFSDLINAKLDERLNQTRRQEAFDYASTSGGKGALASAGSILASLGSGFEYANNLFSGNSERRSVLASMSSGAREGTKENWNGVKGEKFWDFVYDTGMSGADSLAAAGISFVLPGAGEVILGASAAANTANDLLDRGVSGGNVILGSLTAGVLESVFEHVSIGRLKNFAPKNFAGLGFTKQGLKAAAKEIGKSVITNMSEEALTEFSNVVADNLINGELSSYATSIADKYSQGMSLEQAKAEAKKEIREQIARAAASGALMGFGFGAGGSIIGLSSSQISNARNGNIIASDPTKIEALKTLALNSEFKDIAKEAERLSTDSKPTQVGAVFNKLFEKTLENSKTALESELMKKGATKYGTNSASGLAMRILKTATTPKGKGTAMAEGMLSANSIAGETYKTFVNEGKFGGSEVLALNEILTSPSRQNVVQSIFGSNITVNDQGSVVPVSADGKGAATGPVMADSMKGIPGAARSGNVKTLAEAYGERVAEHLKKQKPMPKRPTTKQITPAGEVIVKAVGKSMGVNVVFTDEAIDGFADGKTEDGNTVYISRYTVDPIKVVIKHEFTHSVEGSRLYEKFANYIFNDSVAFNEWLKTKGISTWKEAVKKELNKFEEYGIKYKDPYYMAKTEVIAKFVSENLFTDKTGNNGAIMEDFLAELKRADRNLYERFVDWVKSVFARLKESNAVKKDIIKLEQKFLRLVETVDRNDGKNKATAKNGSGTVYSQSNAAIIDLSDDNELSKAVDGLYGSARYTAIQNYILSTLSEQPVTLSDGKKAIIDKRDALHMANKSGQEKTAHISQIKKIVENAQLVAEEPSAKVGKFDHFYYYEVAVKYDGETYPIYLNVGKARNDATYHLYDITQKLRDTAHRVNDVGRPVGNALKNGISNTSIPNTTENVNKQYSFAGENAKTANRLELSTAKQMLKDGVDSETIRQQTGWFKGMDGKWRFEISDKDIKVNETFYIKNAAEFNKILMKVAVGLPTTPEETQKYNTLATEYTEFFYGTTLGEFIEHTDLFKAYPEIKDINVRILPLPARKGGKLYARFSRKENSLVLNSEMFVKGADPDHEILKYVLVHETQHIIQTIEGFARGSSSVYWQARMQDGEVFKDKDGKILTPKELYERTAGEIESNDVSARIDLNDAQRKKIRPDIDRTDIVFADKELEIEGDEKASLAIPSDHTFVYRNGKASFTENRLSSLLDEHSLGEGKRAEYSNAYVGYISPDDFINLTSNADIRGRVEDDAYVLNEDELRQEAETPFLEYDPETNEVVNHEGRHRMVALKADGVSSVAVVVKPSNDSFERREPQDISLTGQDFAGGRANGEVTLKNAIPLSEKYRTEATAKFAANPDADVRYSIPGDKKITPGMSDRERADALRESKLSIINYKQPQDANIDFEYLENTIKSKAEKHLLKKLQALGYLRHYTTKSVDVAFDFTMRGLRKSTHSQLEYGGNYSDFAKVIINLQELLDSAMLIETHTDKAKGTPRENPQLKQVYVLLSALKDGKNIIPVQFEIKQFFDDNNRLYLAVALTKIETGVMGNTIPNNSQVSTNLVPVSSISIPELFSKINPKDKKFLKYVPDEFLSPKQKEAKKEALREDDVKYGRPNTKYSIPTNAIGKSREELKAMVESGEITLDEAFESLTDQYGALPKGENPKVDVTFPKKISKTQNVMRYARTAAESGHLAEGMSEAQQMDILKGGQTYQVISDDAALSRADNTIKTDFAGAVEHWQDIINSGKQMNKYDIALGERLLQQAAENGHTSDTMKYIAELAELGTRMGQNVQALSLLKKMTGIGKLYYVQRAVDSLNRDIEQKYNGKKEPVKINADLAEMLAKSKSQKDAEAISDDILKDIAAQVPSTFMDKWNAWRYLSMLGNPRTHIRNVVGNAVFVPAIRIKDSVAYMGERFIAKEQRTKVLGALKTEYKDFARNDFNEVKDILTSGGKMNPSDQIRDQQKIFKTKALEILRQKNFAFMEAEDMLFLKMHYVRALGSVLQAKGIDIKNITPEQLNVARLYAIREAQKATYRDASAVAEALNRFQYSKSKSVRAFGMLVEGVLPFKKTPINILKRGVGYSPVGLVTSLTKGIYDLKKGKITASDFIDGISAGLTGTGLLVLGAWLYSLGVVVGGLDYDDEEALERMSGAQEYSLQFGDFSYTIDWMAPAVLPFLVGAEVEKFIESEEQSNPIGFLVDALAAIGEPMTELSMLSGLNDAIETVAYSDNKLSDMLVSATIAYLSQALPTVGGQVARTLDKTRRSNFIDKNSPVPKNIQTTYQKALGKIPFAENTKVPYIDAWGRIEENDNVLLRAFENFVSPGYTSIIKDDVVNDELAKVYVDTGESGVIPKRAKTSIDVNGVTKNLTADEYVQYATDKGQFSRQYIEELINNSTYQQLDSTSKAEVIKDLFSFANAKAKSNVSDYDYVSSNMFKTVAKLESIGVDASTYYVAKIATSVSKADKDGSGTVTKDEYVSAIKNSGISVTDQNKIIKNKYSRK